ncbi:MAG: hypothetical protein ABSF77_18910 [Spirochaetia bacterium]|jgi:hypothetical protein
MPEQLHAFDELATRDGFNRSLRHFKFISRVIGEFEAKRNIAETLSECLADKTIEPRQVLPTLNAILVDKYHYSCRSHNLTESYDDFDTLTETVGTWRAIDMVVAYFHPELGVVVVNPKDRVHWDGVRILKRNELLTIFTGAFAETDGNKLYEAAASLFISLIEGGKVKTPAALTKGKFVFKKQTPAAVAAPPARGRKKAAGRPSKAAAAAAAIDYSAAAAPVATLPSYPSASAPAAAAAPPAAPAPAAPSGAQKKMTPMYSIPVTNELFHNGNVEAWKKIIQSYTTKYPGLEVYVFYEGERIHDINTLFKWGKVKHGSSIMIAVAGDDIRDVAKLQRYLKQGASHMFEAFLKAQVGAVLNLF